MDLVAGRPAPSPPRLPDAVLDCSGPRGCRPTPESLRAIIDAGLKSADPMWRSIAVPGVESMPRLREILADPRGLVRQTAAGEVKRRRDRGALDALRRASYLADDDPQGAARLAAIEARLALGDKPAFGELRSWLGSSASLSRALAARYAAPYPSLRPDLEALAREDPDRAVRASASLGLAELGDRKARGQIRGWWDHRTYRVHAKLDPEGSRARLKRIATGGSADEGSLVERSAAAAALLGSGDRQGRSVLHDLLRRAVQTQSGGQALLLLQVMSEFTQPADLAAVIPSLSAREATARLAAAVVALLAMRSASTPRR
jgi:hypothetical protein